MRLRLFALCTPRGTAAAETCLCENHLHNPRHRTRIISKAPNDVDLEKWHDVTTNDYMECEVCGYTPKNV